MPRSSGARSRRSPSTSPTHYLAEAEARCVRKSEVRVTTLTAQDSEPRRAVADRAVRRLVYLFGCEQHGRLHGCSSRGVFDQRNGCGGLVVGKIDDRKRVAIAELEVKALELAARAAHRFGDRIPPIGAA